MGGEEGEGGEGGGREGDFSVMKIVFSSSTGGRVEW